MPRPLRLVASVVVAVGLLSGCAEEEPQVIDVGTRITSATDALECAKDAEAKPGTAPDDSGEFHKSAEAAVRAWAEASQGSEKVPADGYGVAVEEVGMVLFTHESDGRAEVAVIAHRGEDADGDLGWTVRSWARCRG